MKTSLNKRLANTGIQPSSFAFFLQEFQKQHKGKSKLSKLLTAQLKAQADLILHHLTH